MYKSIVEFSDSVLKVDAGAFLSKRNTELRNELKRFADENSLTLTFTYIDSDSFRAELKGGYEDIIKAIQLMEEKGWEW